MRPNRGNLLGRKRPEFPVAQGSREPVGGGQELVPWQGVAGEERVEERGWAYRRRQPEGTVLYEAVKDNLATLLAEASEVGRGLPRYVERDVTMRPTETCPVWTGRAAAQDVRPGCVRVLEVWRQAAGVGVREGSRRGESDSGAPGVVHGECAPGPCARAAPERVVLKLKTAKRPLAPAAPLMWPSPRCCWCSRLSSLPTAAEIR
jgi:hypothetical protein